MTSITKQRLLDSGMIKYTSIVTISFIGSVNGALSKFLKVTLNGQETMK